MEKQQQQFSLWYFLIAFLAILVLQSILFAPHAENLAYSEFKTLLKAGKVDNLALGERAITGSVPFFSISGSEFVEMFVGVGAAREIDRAVRTIIQDAFDQAVATLKARRDTLDRGARELLAHETLTEGELRELLKPAPVAAAAAST